MTVALVSLLTGIPVRDDVAMTGEITLRGQVLPVGGIKMKALAARRAGVNTFVLPKRNEADLDDLPAELREEMTFVLAETLDDVLAARCRGISSPCVHTSTTPSSTPSRRLLSTNSWPPLHRNPRSSGH